ncbi:sulfurtransferase [Aquabacter spiritensis]|uniref:Thiosulfate/3-mercaptopyruvate sulfurtransferase n=1 Tax=Aquabacter spiritensis TaxID=933073 RepID=A0A4R3M909_9HYPH|nr:sulfurtransferase [Aquabacter spiritensis]TCT07855.1 thiosulfate/3-mercaptopyruvate sulfurtransferase [Aquabacter spiritensis]
MASDTLSGVVSTEWLAAHLAEPDLRILDCTWHHTSTNLDGRTQYRGRHLPGSVHFDIDHVADPATSLPHMLPSAADFAKKVALLGIGSTDRVVVYDRLSGGSAAARVWWMFRVFGHRNVALLDGGFGKWLKDKLPTEMTAVRPEPKAFSAAVDASLVRTLGQMTANLESGAEQVIDARGPGRFAGLQPDVFPFKKLGHIPGAINVPWADLIHPETGAMLPPAALAARFAAAGIDLGRPCVATCASGITSCVTALGLFLLGQEATSVYDGSWAEWERADDMPAVVAA